jgi:hypothetical protein
MGVTGPRFGSHALTAHSPPEIIPIIASSSPLERHRRGALEMRAHPRRRGFRIACENRLGDGAMLLDRGFEHGRGQHIADLGHDERQLQPRRELAELKIVGKRHHRVVEGGVLLEIFAWDSRRLGVDRLNGRDKARPRLVGVRPGGEPSGESLDFNPDQEQLADLALPETSDHRAPVWPVLDQSLGGEPPQRLPDRPAADREPGGEVAFDEAQSRLKPAGQDIVPQTLDDESDGCAMRWRNGRAPAPRWRLASGCGV